MKVEVLPRAEEDIVRQFRYYLVEQDALVAAVRFREAVAESMKLLKKQPRIGPTIRCSIPGLRSWPVRGFNAIRIYYLEAPGALRIVRILHGKRNVRRILNREELF